MPETSALQCWQSEAAKWHRLVGFGCRPRCAPACGLRFGLRCSPSLPLCPRDGGVLELSGFFGGRLSLARSSAFSARSAAFSASKISNRAVKSFRRSNNARISASFPALSRRAKSGGRVIHRLTHVPSRKARLFLIMESICRTFLWIHAPQRAGRPEQLRQFKSAAANIYRCVYDDLQKKLCTRSLLHVDETSVSVKGRNGYVWILASMDQVAYFFTPTREGGTIQAMLKGFSGVLV